MIGFKEWLILESSDQVVLMKAVDASGSESIKKGGFQLQDRHRSTAHYYKKYGDTSTEQMYGPGLYFTVVPVGQDPFEYAKKNCKMYSQWGGHIVFATIKRGGRGLVTGFPENHPMWKYNSASRPDIYEQLNALGVNDIIGYEKGGVHTDKEWGYKLHDKIDFWAHFHWAEGGEARFNVVVYNPSVLQPAGEFDCGTGEKKQNSTPNDQANSSQTQTGVIDGTPYSIPNDQANSSQTLRAKGGSGAQAGGWRLIPQPEGQAPPGKVWSKLLGRWRDAPETTT